MKKLIQEKINEIKSKYFITTDKSINFKILSEIAHFKNGKIKEGESYINSKTKMIFIDQFGNEFKMIPNQIKSGRWSPFEAGKVYDSNYHMKELRKIALSKRGKIKEGESYINSKTKMTFIDQLGNEFKITPNKIKSGQWSPFKSGKVRDPTYHMEELQRIALSKGGKIKEGEIYINSKTKMTFIDQLGNEFKVAPNAVKKGDWSPYKINAKKIKIIT